MASDKKREKLETLWPMCRKTELIN